MFSLIIKKTLVTFPWLFDPLNWLSLSPTLKTIVCKHWLRGLCKKGDQCEFLHEYDMSKMPECYFYTRFSEFYLNCIFQKKI